jgi:hypothetical protein
LRTGSPAKSSFSDVHIRMLELPVKMMPPFGGGFGHVLDFEGVDVRLES